LVNKGLECSRNITFVTSSYCLQQFTFCSGTWYGYARS